MKRIIWLALSMSLLLLACQPQVPQIIVTILDGSRLMTIKTLADTPAAILAKAGLVLANGDSVQYRGADLPVDFPLPGGSYVLQVRRAHMITLSTPEGQIVIHSSAATLGEALAQSGRQLYSADFIAPPLQTPLATDLAVTYRPARDLSIVVDGAVLKLKSAAQTVGQALAAGGVTLLGLDKSLPQDADPLPADGQIRVLRITELVKLEEKQLPFAKQIQYSADVPAGTQKVLQAGVPGLAVTRVRIRFEDGAEVSRLTEAETVVRLPQDSLISLSTLVEVKTLAIPGGQIQYWRAVQMYATSYSPCRSGTSACSYGTASGVPVKRGVVAMVRSLYNQLSGSQVYIPGYGLAVIADVGGGFPDGRLWVDLGFSDDDYQTYSGMVTVYFLAPAPNIIPAILQ